jgi:amino acid permease
MGKLKSRKFWMALIGAVLPQLGLLVDGVSPTVSIGGTVAIIISYILGQGYVDAHAGDMAGASTRKLS